MIRRVVAISGQ